MPCMFESNIPAPRCKLKAFKVWSDSKYKNSSSRSSSQWITIITIRFMAVRFSWHQKRGRKPQVCCLVVFTGNKCFQQNDLVNGSKTVFLVFNDSSYEPVSSSAVVGTTCICLSGGREPNLQHWTANWRFAQLRGIHATNFFSRYHWEKYLKSLLTY